MGMGDIWWQFMPDGTVRGTVPKVEDASGTVSVDITPEGVAKRVDGVIDDCLNGRLTPPQKAGVRSAIDRSDRVKPESDKAIGRILGG